MQGDYTQNSKDSRIFGPLPYGLIQGRVLWRVCIILDKKKCFAFLFGDQSGL